MPPNELSDNKTYILGTDHMSVNTNHPFCKVNYSLHLYDLDKNEIDPKPFNNSLIAINKETGDISYNQDKVVKNQLVVKYVQVARTSYSNNFEIEVVCPLVDVAKIETDYNKLVSKDEKLLLFKGTQYVASNNTSEACKIKYQLWQQQGKYQGDWLTIAENGDVFVNA